MLKNYENWLLTRQYSEKTIRVYIRKVEKFLDRHPHPFDIELEHISNYLLTLRKNGLGLTSLEGHFCALKNFYNYLSISGKGHLILDKNPLKDIMPIKRQKRVPKIIPEDDLSALLRAPDLKQLRGCRDYVIMLFLLHGLRSEEICNLKRQSIFSDGWGAGRKMIIDVQGKGRKERRISMERSGDTEWAWQRYLTMRNGDSCQNAFPAIIGNRTQKMTPNGLYRMLARYGYKLGIKLTHPHVWRHTAAVSMLEEGVPIKEIQLRLGHESVATTEIYFLASTISQENAANSNWIHRLKKADSRFRRWKRNRQ